MKVLEVISSLNPRTGGTAESLKQLEKILSSKHTIEILCLDKPKSPWLRDFKSKIYALGPAITRYAFSKRLLGWLRKNAVSYDCIIVNGIWQYVGFAVWLILKNSETPYFIYAHGMLDPWFKKNYLIKHLKKSIYWPIQYRILKDAEAVVFNCKEEARLASKSFWPNRWNSKIISHGIFKPPVNKSHLVAGFLDRYKIPRNQNLILFLGRIHEKKGIDNLVKSFAELSSDYRLIIAGPESAYGNRMKRLAKKLGISHKITWTGMLENDLKWGAFYASDAFILPSHQENFGIAVVEALACGLPVLISDKVNIWKKIYDFSAGFVENDSLEGTSKLLKRWHLASEEKKKKMAKSAKICFESNFDINKNISQLIRLVSK